MPNLKTKFACINLSESEACQSSLQAESDFQKKGKNWVVVGNPEPEELGLLANLCSLCTFNLCSVEETNILGTGLKLEASEQRSIPFPSPSHVDWLPGEQKPLPAAACQLLPFLPPFSSTWILWSLVVAS